MFRFRKGAQSEKKWLPKKDASKPESEPTEELTFLCEDCGSRLTWARKKDGTGMSPQRIKEYSHSRFGRTLCADCLRKTAGKHNTAFLPDLSKNEFSRDINST